MRLLVDTSIWIDHLHHTDRELSDALLAGSVWTHTAVIGELACGSLARRNAVLELLKHLPRLPDADLLAVLSLIESQRLWGKGLSWVDVHLLAACSASATHLWTRDQRLQRAARDLGVAHG